MTKFQIATAALAMALSVGTALPARADDPYSFDKVFRMMDKNKDTMVTRQEFLDAMGKVYDDKMKVMKADPKMVKDNMMTRDGLKDLLGDIYKGA